MAKQTIVHTYYRVLLSNKKEWTADTCNNLNESLENYTEWKKPKGYALHDPIYITFLNDSCRNG